ncbi:MAG: hypothetical protein LBR15_04310 [Methanobrevibacter sp.]|jgi:hypothetical protein|nr:hypothetical protein [Candidatus Methanovirga australis]
MKFKILFKAVLVIFLIANIGFIQGEQITITKNTDSDIMFREEMNTPLNQSEKNTLSSSNPLFDWLCVVNPNLTKGQAMAFTSMVSKQMNKSEQFTLNLYLDYLSSNNEHPIEGINLTARELYDKSPPVKDFIDRMDEQVVIYSKLSREEACDYLLTEAPSNDVTNRILKNADINEINYYIDDIQNLADVIEPLFKNISADKIKKIGNVLEEATNDFNHNISVHNMLYKMDLEDGIAPNLLKYTQNNSYQTKEYIKEMKDSVNKLKNCKKTHVGMLTFITIAIGFFTGVTGGLIALNILALGIMSFVIALVIGCIIMLIMFFTLINNFGVITDNTIANLEKIISSLESI